MKMTTKLRYEMRERERDKNILKATKKVNAHKHKY